MSDNPLIRLAGLYERASERTGNRYLTGRLNAGTRLVVFKNHRKEKETDPDWVVFIRAELRDQDRPAADQHAQPASPQETTGHDFDDPLPF